MERHAPGLNPAPEDDEESEPELADKGRMLVNFLKPTLDKMPRHKSRGLVSR